MVNEEPSKNITDREPADILAGLMPKMFKKNPNDKKGYSSRVFIGELVPSYWDDENRFDSLQEAINNRDEKKLFEMFDEFDKSRSEDHFIEYSKTKNPLMAWYQIRFCCFTPIGRYIYFQPKIILLTDCGWNPEDPRYIKSLEFAEIDEMSVWVSSVAEKRPSTLPLPEWCLKYLGFASRKILSLYENDENTSEYIRQKLPETLSLQRPGWNAFADRKNRARNAKVLIRFQELICDGTTKTEAQKVVADEFNIEDTRSVQRIIAAMLVEGGKT